MEKYKNLNLFRITSKLLINLLKIYTSIAYNLRSYKILWNNQIYNRKVFNKFSFNFRCRVTRSF